MAGPPGWSIERGDATVFLFGVRPGARDSAWVTEPITSAIAASDEFWRETPPEDEITSSPLLAELGLSDVPLSQRLDETTRRRLDAVADALALDGAAKEFDVEGILRTFADMSEALELDYLRFILDAAEAGPALIDEPHSLLALLKQLDCRVTP